MKHTKKKRILAIVLCMILVLSTGIAAFANENVGLQSVACQAATLERVIKNAEGEDVGTLIADIPEGTFLASSSDANIQMDVQADVGADGVLDRVQQQLEANGETGYTLNNYVMADVTFYVNGEKQVPQQPITFHVSGTSIDTENVMAFADDRQNTTTLMDADTDENGGLQFTAQPFTSETVVYGIFDVTEAAEENTDSENAIAIDTQAEATYEQTYSDDQVEIKVSAAEGVLPEDAQLSVTPIVKTDITDKMSKEEKQTAEEINTKYDETEQKLNEKATEESYSVAGFLAYDITFTDKDGNKIEPTGDVNVSMNYKEATIPEEAQKAIEEKTDDAAMNVTVMHLEENAQGEVEKVVDMVADENEKANVETTDTQSVQKAEFVSDSFSVFTLTWNKSTYSKKYNSSISIKVVDSTGADIGENTSYTFNSSTYNGRNVSGSGSLELEAIKKDITDYTYNKATLDSVTGTEITNVQCNVSESRWEQEPTYTWQYSSDGTNWNDLGTHTIYFVYDRNPDVRIKDDIVNTGKLEAEYAPNSTGTVPEVTSYTWYRSDSKTGNYTKVERVKYQATETNIKSNLSDNGRELYPAYDDGARKWYKVKVTLSDGKEEESLPFQVTYYDQLQNGSFEKPVANKQWSNADYKAAGGVWQTTGIGGTGKIGQDIEIVNPSINKGGYSDYSWKQSEWEVDGTTNKSKAPADGNQFAELNCEAAGALYQDVLTKENVSLNYWLSHHARGTNPNSNQRDTMFLVIMPTSMAKDLTSQRSLENKLTELGVDVTARDDYSDAGSNNIVYGNTPEQKATGVMVVRITSSNQQWQTVSGTNYTPTSSLTRFFFMSGRTENGSLTVGNFLDNVGFSQEMPPVADDEFSLQIKKDFKGLGSTDINKVIDKISFKINATKDGEELTDDQVTKLFGRTTISGTEMTQQIDGSLVYIIANKKIGVNDSYQVTITEENAGLDGYTLKTSAKTSIQTDGNKDSATEGNGSVIAELKGKVAATVTFTNEYEENNLKNINFTKIWDDANNKYKTRPTSLNVTLHGTYKVTENGTTQTKTLDLTNRVTPSTTITINEGSKWKCSWKVPVYYTLENGTKVKINYTVTEGDNGSEYVYKAVTDEKGNAISGNGSDYKSTFTGITSESANSDTTNGASEKKGILSRIRTAVASVFADTNSVAVTSAEDTEAPALGEPAHTKYITYNEDTLDYTLNLDVTGAKGSAKGVDVLFVIDTSGSMGKGNGSSTYTNLLPKVKSLLTDRKGIVDKIFAKDGNTNSIAMVSFSDKDGTKTTSWYTASEKETFKTSVNQLSASGGTNWTYAMVKAQELLAQRSNSGNDKVVIFLSDGKPTYSCEKKTSWYGGTYWEETGNGKKTKDNYYTEAAAQVTGSLSNAKMYSVYLTSGTKSGMQKFSDELSNSDLVDGTNLDSALTNILNKVIPTYKNVTITDTLSEYVDFVGTQPTVTVTKKTTGNNIVTLVNGTDYTANVSGKKVSVRLLNGNSLEDGATYTVSFKVKPSDAANSYYARYKEYPETGDAGTGSTSAGKKGFYSNDSAQTKLQYEIDGTDEGLQKTSYIKPVVQVTTHTLTYTKVWNQPEGITAPTQDIILHVTYTDGTTGDITLRSQDGYTYKETVPATKSIAQITEEAVEDYAASYSITDRGTNAVVTNNYQKVTANSITVKKVWKGDGPKSDIEVSLYQSVNGGDAIVYETVTLNKDNEWQHTWKNLPKYEGSASDQKTYSYAVREENIPNNYQSSISYEYGNDSIIATITNTYDPNCKDENYYIANVLQTEKLHINKIWDDNGNIAGLRPNDLKVTVNSKEYTLSGDSDYWTQDVTILKKKKASYVASEKLENDNYILVNNAAKIEPTADGVNITFTNQLNTKDITVKKNWNDGNAENRPTSVKIRLEYRNKGSNDSWNVYDTYTITEEDNNGTNAWTKVIHNLPTAYEYQVVELNSNDEVATAENNGNYVPSITKSGDTYTITNTLKWFAVKKSIGWDGDTSKSVGLSGAEFELKQNDTTIATGTSGDNGAITWVTADGQNVDLNSLNGTYVIHETKAPEGYMKSDKDWTVEFGNGLLTKLDGAAVTGDGNTGVEITLTNKKLYNLPHTGGSGIFLYMIGGMLLMGGAAWILYKNKRREVLKR